MYNLRNRHFLTLADYSKKEILFLLQLAQDLKTAKYTGTEQPRLIGKNIALIFEKNSTRTRCAFEVAAHDQGAHVTYLGPTGSQLGNKETAKDTARVLGGMYDGIEYRGFEDSIVEELAENAGVPVWNGLTNGDHPTQVLADFMTAKEVLNKDYEDIHFAFVGIGENNVTRALLLGAAIVGMPFTLVGPKELYPSEDFIEKCQAFAEKSGAKLTFTEDIAEGVKGADVIYTDVWVSMGEPEDIWRKRIKLLEPYRVTKEVMAQTGNKNTIFLHCLPSFHNTDTTTGQAIYEKYGLKEMEVTDEVFESEQSYVFQEAENRMHTIKAVMVATLGE